MHRVQRRGDGDDRHLVRHPLRRVDGVEEYVERQLDKHRAGAAAEGGVVGFGQPVGDVLGALHGEAGLGEGLEHLRLRHLL